MNEYERAFISKMERIRVAGLDFQAGARAALEAKFGGAADVLLQDFSEEGKREPRQFVEELNRTFGRGSMGFLEPVMKSADMGLFPPTRSSQSALESVLGQLGPASGVVSGSTLGALHEHRIKDEEGNYSDAYN